MKFEGCQGVLSKNIASMKNSRTPSVRDTHRRKICVCMRQVIVAMRNRSKKTLVLVLGNRQKSIRQKVTAHGLSKTPT